MENKIPEEIRNKVISIEKELNEKSFSDNKLALWVPLIGILISLAIIYLFSFFITRFYSIAIFVLAFSLAGNCITRFFEHKKFSKLFSNACDVIHYYRDREVN